jgi:glycerophosphoryl diester phosphodiesterase
MPAFELALADGANALELDVHRTADGHFVVSHDADGARTAGCPDRICEQPLERIRLWRVGESVLPTLTEILEAFPTTPLSIDLKPDDPDAVGPMLELLAAHRGEDRVTVASFHDHLIRQVRRMGWQGRTALTKIEVAALRFAPLVLSRRIVRGHAAQVPVRYGKVRLDQPSFLRRCRRLGIRADYWVVNDRDEARKLLSAGATGVMSDDPAVILPVMKEFE